MRTSRPSGARPSPESSFRHSQSVPSQAFPAWSLDGEAVSSPDGQGSADWIATAAAPDGARPRERAIQSRDYGPNRFPQPTPPSQNTPVAMAARERGQRWMLRDEAASLEAALGSLDLSTAKSTSATLTEDPVEEVEDGRLYQQAWQEASNLIWDHKHGYLPRKPQGPYRYRPNPSEDSATDSHPASPGQLDQEPHPITPAEYPSGGAYTRSPWGSSIDSVGSGGSGGGGGGGVGAGKSGTSRRPLPSTENRDRITVRDGDHQPLIGRDARHGSLGPARHRDTPAVGTQRHGGTFSGNPTESTAFRFSPATQQEDVSAANRFHPSDRYHDSNLTMRPGDGSEPFPRRTRQPVAVRSDSFSTIDIHRNPPSQSRNPLYTRNFPSSPLGLQEKVAPKKHGMEIRAGYIREATSMRLKDRSTNLPQPTLVSDNPGRPIVSFNRDWDPDNSPSTPNTNTARLPAGSDADTESVFASSVPATTAPRPGSVGRAGSEPARDRPSISVSPPPLPIIVLDEATTDGAPCISVSPPAETTQAPTSARPLPTPTTRGPIPAQRSNRALPRPGSSITDSATCHECGHTIHGRFVALGGCPQRFHPHCFSCVVCATSLEALEIHPEPEPFRRARLERIQCRARGEVLPEEAGKTMAEDGDDRLRFYCHLDWHELFAPRCKHCKTPILGEHIIALGSHWHQGHFFCAECGDPFEHGATHIEKDGYAWCVKCQTKMTERRAPKCRKCKTPVIGQYIVALGGEWHDHCFRCASCDGGFDDGQIFPRETAEAGVLAVCTHCRAMELKC